MEFVNVIEPCVSLESKNINDYTPELIKTMLANISKIYETVFINIQKIAPVEQLRGVICEGVNSCYRFGDAIEKYLNTPDYEAVKVEAWKKGVKSHSYYSKMGYGSGMSPKLDNNNIEVYAQKIKSIDASYEVPQSKSPLLELIDYVKLVFKGFLGKK